MLNKGHINKQEMNMQISVRLGYVLRVSCYVVRGSHLLLNPEILGQPATRTPHPATLLTAH